MAGTESPHRTDVAIIGMACRFPGAADIEEFARLAFAGEIATTTLDTAGQAERGVAESLRRHPEYVPTAGLLDGIDQFDAAYFGIAPADAASMDPQHRVFLQEAVRALDDAGWSGADTRSVGVFAGAGENRYAARRPVGAAEPRLPWDLPAALPLLVSYHLDLHGPSVYVSSMCSTSLAAVHVARRALQAGDCDLAVAGAVSITLPDSHGYLRRNGGVMSPSGRCRPFDAAADGTVPGSGAGVVVLKRLADARRDGDRVYAVIRGSALNNDGGDRLSFAAPSVRGQRDVILAALADAAVDAASVSYVEAHGTGTPLGDPVEMAALAEARASLGATGPCAVGGVKSAIGHLDEAAGAAGLIRAVLAVRDGIVPPTPGHRDLNPAIRLEDTGLYVTGSAHPWPAVPGPRRAAVTSLGVGGTNAHVVIEEAPEFGEQTRVDEDGVWVLPVSAHTEAAFTALRTAVATSDATPAALAVTLARRRTFPQFRQAAVLATRDEVAAAFGAAQPAPPAKGIVFALPDTLDPADTVLERLGAAPSAAPAALRLIEALARLGVRADTLTGAGAGAFHALAAAGSVSPAVAAECTRLHVDGMRVVAEGGDLTRCDDIAEAIAAALAAAAPGPLRCDVVLRHSGIVLHAGSTPSPDDLAEEARCGFMGLLDEPDGPAALPLADALASWECLLRMLASCWEAGADVDWAALRPRPEGPRAHLPVAFDPRRHWLLDRSAPAPAEPVPGTTDAAQVDLAGVDVAAELAEIWCEVLGVDRVSPDDRFFELGGHSILAARMLARILDRLHVRCTLVDLLEPETLAEMTERVAARVRLSSLYSQMRSDHAQDDAETVEL
ncbi:ketoacyl-synthetase-like protein [Micromonospora sp. M71_S20]|uniref:polyketide synthase n=1 Tax=Micromonospora sp. M71_S20 TaxID=592872 RepID=UPI000EAC96A7|nr:polyketide synthase [Micromonospora sp. M71_S20]RLK09780.1 ketoacyl-synthetase-like protein [Micromonospora sp. M71_S20]